MFLFGTTTIKIKTFGVVDIIMAHSIKTSCTMANLVELNYGRGRGIAKNNQFNIVQYWCHNNPNKDTQCNE
jgi:hypothetical protein